MSHLSRHQNKDIIKKLAFFIIGIGILGFFAIQIGLKSIINTTLFLNETMSGNATENNSPEKSSDFFGTLNVDEPPNATNSADIMVSGESSEYEKLEYYINNTKVKEGTAKDSFEEKIGKLKPGENSVYILAKTEDGKNKKESARYTVYYKNEPPKLEINSPKDGDTVSKQDIQIEGKTDAEASVSVNNQPIVVDYQGNFKKTFRLKEGENKLNFVAEDEAGNRKESSITVKYQKDE